GLDVSVIGHDVRRLLCLSAVEHYAPVGTTTRCVRERRGTTPLAALARGRSITAVTGLPVRFY
ncbi:MAG TPA: hypothetical protein VED43_07515, partial [Mycobacterium sp.]|nr:hypothetical protein [Mycobacterium sp.]